MNVPPPGIGDARIRRLAFGALVTALTAALFPSVLMGEVLVERDMLTVYLPLGAYWRERVAALSLPQWYPYDGFGQPFIGMLISGTFHPARLLLLRLPPLVAATVTALACYPAAASGAYSLARRLGQNPLCAAMAGVTYGFCGYLVSLSNNLLYLVAAATLPWVLARADRWIRDGSPGALLVCCALHASILFAGDPQTFAIAGAAILLLVVHSSAGGLGLALRRALGAIAGGLGLSAVQLWPAVQVWRAAWSESAATMDPQQFSLHPLRIPELLFGPYFFEPALGQPAMPLLQVLEPGPLALWSNSICLGAIALGLAGFAAVRHRRSPVAWALLGVALLSLVLALGRHTPVYGWVYSAVPLWRAFRYPEKLLPYFSLAVALGAGVGLARLGEVASIKRGAVFFAVAALAAAAAAGAWTGVIVSLSTGPDTLFAPRWVGFAGLAAGTALVAGLGVSFLPNRHAALLLVGLQSLQLLVAGAGLPTTTATEIFSAPHPFADEIARREGTGLGQARVRIAKRANEVVAPSGLSREEAVAAGLWAALEGAIPGALGLESGNLHLPAVSPAIRGAGQSSGFLRDVGPRFGLGYWTVEADEARQVDTSRYEVVSALPKLEVALLHDRQVWPRSFIAAGRCLALGEDPLSALAAASPGVEAALLDCSAVSVPDLHLHQGDGTVVPLLYEPEHLRLSVETDGPAVLVVNDAFYPGWTATRDGELLEIFRANGGMRSVLVPGGKSAVDFHYVTPGLLGGGAISGVSLLWIFALWIYAALRSRRRASVG